MKQLIVLCAVFLLLAAIILQIPLEMINYERKHAIMFYVNNAKEMAKQEGYYTDEILNDLTSNIAKKMNIKNINEIIIDDKTTKTPKYRPDKFDSRETIYLKVSVPFKNILATPGFYGISDSENKGYYIIEEITTSEKLRSN